MTIEEVLITYGPVIKGTVALFNPFLEVAVHDIKKNRIAALYNTISNRKVGDQSPLAKLKTPVEKFPDIFEPYYETNWDGRKIKCTTVTIRDERKNPIALICYNLDTSAFQEMQQSLNLFLNVKENAANPVEMFSEKWQEKVDQAIDAYLLEHKLLIGSLDNTQKKQLVEELSKQGIFFLKNAAPYVANKLKISRATVYNYLKVLRSE